MAYGQRVPGRRQLRTHQRERERDREQADERRGRGEA
jgi:hypothetical protein